MRSQARAESADLVVGGWLAIASGSLIAIGCFLPWVTAQTVLGESIDRNGLQLGAHLAFSADGIFGLVIGAVTALLGLCRLNRSAMPAWFAQSPLWPGIGGTVFLAAEFASLSQLVAADNKLPGIVAAFGVGLWVIAAGVVLALVSAFILHRTKGPSRAPSRTLTGSVPLGLHPSPPITPAAAGVDDPRRGRDLPVATGTPAGNHSVMAELKAIAELRDSGILTDAEFQAKKTELLGRI